MLTPLQQEKLTHYFHLYDVDDDGRVARTDFERVAENVRALHLAAEKSVQHRSIRDGFLLRWETLRASADADDNGAVDLTEWLRHWEEVLADEARYQNEVAQLADRLFELFDTDGDGVLGADEFCNFYGIYGLKAAMARLVFLDLDVDGDGDVTRQELMDMVHEFYRGDDPSAPGNRLFGPVGMYG
jgi:Ca2+-binding EF-hand superfamily protein